MTILTLDDQNLGAKSESQAKKFESDYGQYIQIAADAMKNKFKYEWSQADTLAFGQYAQTWESYRPVLEADLTSRNALGPALQSNLGLIAMSYAALPIQNLASVQPLTDEAGTVFFRKGVAVNSRGGVNAGDQLLSPYGSVNQNIGEFASESQVASAAFVAGTDTYNVALGRELRPGSVKITVDGGKIKGMDDGEGHILGVGIDADASTVNYGTGAATIKLVGATTRGISDGSVIDVAYSQSVIDSDTIPTMKWILQSKVITSDYYILQSQYSNLSELVLRKRFGADLANQVTADLVTQITSSVMFKAISKLRQASIRNELALGEAITFSLVAPAGISDLDHRRTFDDKLIEASGVMYKLAGKGDVSTLVVGTKGKQILRSAGMTVIKNAVSGPHLCGMYGDIPVYYAPNSVLGDNEILVIYRGTNWYEAPLVYAPFLPVTTVTGNSTTNVMVNAQAAYHSAAIDTVADGFVARITLVV